MRGSWRATTFTAVAVIVVFAANTAASGRTASVTSVNVNLRGSLAITWHGDPARGCAAVGLCAIHGELILSSSGGEGFGSSSGLSGLPISLGGTVRVRNDSESPSGECVDVMNAYGPTPGPGVTLIKRGNWTAVLDPPASSGRCAGPVAADLARIALPLSVRGGRYPTFDLGGTRSFTAGPFSGTASSTLVVQTSPSAGGSSGGSGGSFTGSFFPPKAPAQRPLFEHVDLRYRVSTVASAIDVGFQGAAAPVCEGLDSCGITGTVGFSAAPHSETVTVTTSRPVRARVSRARALQDLKDGRLTFDYPSEAPASGEVTESVRWPTGSTCGDSIPASGIAILLGPVFGPASTGTLPLSLQAFGQPSGDVLRTHCPGPADFDMIGQNEILASGSLKPGQLLAKRSVVDLTNPGPFAALGYSGQRKGSIELELTLLHVAAGTETVP